VPSFTIYEKLSVLPAVRDEPFPANVKFDDVSANNPAANPELRVIGFTTDDGFTALEMTYEKFSYKKTGSVYDPNERSGIITS
jgi:hypothetical protein